MSSKYELEDLLDGYQAYLLSKEIQPHTVRKNAYRLKCFIQWAEDEHYDEIRYPEMTKYIRYCQENELNAQLINSYLLAVRHFFDYLNKEEIRYLNPVQDYNPATGIRIKGIQQKIRTDYLSVEQLEELYEKYEGQDKVLLGLLVFQGLKVREIELLEKIHFDLKKGTVYVPATAIGRSRKLKLATAQLYDLIQHINSLQKPTLLISKYLQNHVQRLIKKLREINPKITNSTQLRGSRISHWVRTQDLRHAQYLAGHSTVSGTEKYRQVNLEDLIDEINKHHPLR